MRTSRLARWAVSSICDQAVAGAFGSRKRSHEIACAWVLAATPAAVLEVPAELRESARLDLLYHTAMSGPPRELARCDRRRLARKAGGRHERTA
jgi:hypothetical protein